MPMSISADEYAIYINRSLRIKSIPLQEVKSIYICPRQWEPSAYAAAVDLWGTGAGSGSVTWGNILHTTDAPETVSL